MTRRIGSSWNPPPGYREAAIGGTLLVAREGDFDALVSALGMGTLHAWASAQPGAKAMQGRGVAWATTLPGGTDVVVRHSRHGGMLAPLTQDLFLAPTRAPEELAISERLRGAGVRTPQVVGYAVYSVAGPLCRADVVTAHIDAVDLPTALNAAAEGDHEAIEGAIVRLLDTMSVAYAKHPDLNARNVLIDRRNGTTEAWVIDVDRVGFVDWVPKHHFECAVNAVRLGHSILKLQNSGELTTGHQVAFRYIDRLRAIAQDLSAKSRTT
jgi:hypothetical protein